MKAAHQGVAPSALPGFGGGWLNMAPPLAQSSEGAAADTAQRNTGGNGGTLDSWLLDKLFGRH